jgi:hypothetical protein
MAHPGSLRVLPFATFIPADVVPDDQRGIRASTLRTLVAVHLPPRTVRIPRARSSAAISGQRGDTAISDILNDQQNTSRKLIGRCFLCFRPPHQVSLSRGKAMKADPRWFLERTGRLIRHQANFLKIAVVMISIAHGTFTRIGAAEDRDLDPAVFVLALDPPITARHAVSKDFGLQVIVGHLHTPG